MIVFRVQDKDGRGPWKPGFSHQWVEDRDDHENLVPWLLDIGPAHLKMDPSKHAGTACESMEQLRRWFTHSEYNKLLKFGYRTVSLHADKILGRSDIQLVFERRLPLNKHVSIICLYP